MGGNVPMIPISSISASIDIDAMVEFGEVKRK
jgi:hypothetical protein